jgi:thiol-disulfide isomerase/thioredoxin
MVKYLPFILLFVCLKGLSQRGDTIIGKPVLNISPQVKTEILQQASLYEGRQLPCFELYDTANSKKSCKEVSNKVLVIEFWFTSCQPCIAQLPFMKKAQDRLRSDTSIKFLSICVDNIERKERWKEMVLKYSIEGIALFLPKNKPAQASNRFFTSIDEYPTFMLVSRTGKILGILDNPSEDFQMQYQIYRGKKGIPVKKAIQESWNGDPVFIQWFRDNLANITRDQQPAN